MDMVSADVEAENEPPSFTILEGNPEIGLILICDHAANQLPCQYGTLGLTAETRARHIAWDPGARDVAVSLARRLNVPAVLSGFSRLLIDPNRGRDDPTLIMRLSDRAVIPGNRKLDEEERSKRLSLYYEPYHRAIDRVIDGFLREGVAPLLLSIHSFTESWKQHAR